MPDQKKLTSDEALRGAIKSIEMLSGASEDTRGPKIAAMALNILEKDLGSYSDSAAVDYALDEATRDRLIAHARQDASHAVLIAYDILAAVSQLERRLRNTQIALTVFGSAIVLLLILHIFHFV